ncbi:hypothetical protein ACIPY6_37215 [Streptomyces sp. NPDC090054]|uniref:hypothetical protein n=1 Tax=Streptomyces sp. NPDC090054 TaxID=3365933 RepID=UPI00382756FA
MFYSTRFSTPAAWPLPPANVLGHVYVAYLFGHTRIHYRRPRIAWLIPIPLWAATTFFFGLFSITGGSRADDLMMWAVWGAYCTPGLFLLTLAIRAWFGVVDYPPRTPADPRPLSRRLMMRLASTSPAPRAAEQEGHRLPAPGPAPSHRPTQRG